MPKFLYNLPTGATFIMEWLRLLSLVATAVALVLVDGAAVEPISASTDGAAVNVTSRSTDGNIEETSDSTDEAAGKNTACSIKEEDATSQNKPSSANDEPANDEQELSSDEVNTIELMHNLDREFTPSKKGSCEKMIYTYGKLLREYESENKINQGSIYAWFNVKGMMNYETLISLSFVNKTPNNMSFGFST